MSLHYGDPTTHTPICGGNAARITDDRDHPSISCNRCVVSLGLVHPEGCHCHDGLAHWPPGPAIRPPGERHRSELPMIDRPPRRILDDACYGCEMSATYCGANRSLNNEDCCGRCTHGGNT